MQEEHTRAATTSEQGPEQVTCCAVHNGISVCGEYAARNGPTFSATSRMAGTSHCARMSGAYASMKIPCRLQ